MKTIIYEVRTMGGQGCREELIGMFSGITPEMQAKIDKEWFIVRELPIDDLTKFNKYGS